MTAPAYTTDLAVFKDFESAVTFGEFSGYTGGRGQAIDTDYPIQGNSMMSVVMNTTGAAGVAVDYGSNISWTSGWAMFSWLIWLAPAAIDIKVNGGLVFCLGSSTSDYREWYVGGSNFGSYPYGGWQNFAVDPEVTYSAITGSPGTAYRWAGPGAKVISAVAKGSPLAVDVIRYGRGEFRVVAGESGNYATFSGMAAWNDDSSRRWGLFQAIEGGYKFKGLMILGYGGLINFTDLNKIIVVDNTQYVQSGFNRIEIRNASSTINWTNISMTALGTVSKGEFEIIDDAVVNLSSCTFTDMSTFIFKPKTTILDTTFRRCGLVTQNSAALTGCIFGSTADASRALLANNPTAITNCEFISSGTKHAVEINTPGEYSLSDNIFTGYATSNGDSGNEVIYNNSGGQVTLNASGNIGVVSYRNGSGATTSVVSSITLTLSGLKDGSDISILNAGTETERINVQQNSGTTYNYNYTSAGESIDVGIFKIGYVPLYVRGYVLGATNSSLPVSQVIDRAYLE